MSVVWALALKSLRSTRRVRSTRAVVTSCVVPFFLTLLILGAAVAIGALPAATRRVAIDPAAVRGTFLRPEAVRALGPLVVAVEESPAAAAATNSTPLLLDALARALGFADGWASAGSSVAAVASGAQLEARCGGGGGGGGPCLAGLLFSPASVSNSGGGGAYKLRLDTRQALARRYSTNNALRLDVELLSPLLQAAADAALLSGTANASSAAAALRSVVVVPNRFARIKLAEALRDYGGAALFAVCFFATLYAFSLDLLWEKERRVRDGFFVVGVSRTEYGCGWLLVAAGLALPGWVLAAALASGTLPSAGFGALLALYVLAGLASLLVCLALDAVFSSADTGPACVLAFFAGALGAGVALLGVDQGGASAGTLRAACLLPPAAFVLGYARLADAERAHAVGDAASDRSAGVDLATALGFLAADVLGYALLALYLSRVIPQARGAARHPLFCLRGALAWVDRRRVATLRGRRLASSLEALAGTSSPTSLPELAPTSLPQLSPPPPPPPPPPPLTAAAAAAPRHLDPGAVKDLFHGSLGARRARAAQRRTRRPAGVHHGTPRPQRGREEHSDRHFDGSRAVDGRRCEPGRGLCVVRRGAPRGPRRRVPAVRRHCRGPHSTRHARALRRLQGHHRRRSRRRRRACRARPC